MKFLGAAIAVSAFLFAACRPGVKPEHRLSLTVSPLQVEAGQRVTLTATAVDKAELVSVSGTVAAGGMPVIPLKYDVAQHWWYQAYSIPVFWVIPQGKYEIKAWGESKAGDRYEGNTFIEIK